jgi:hypothetical protein
VTEENKEYAAGLLAALAATHGRPQLTGVWYHDTQFSLDGYHFVGCRFDRCTLHVSSGNFELTNCFVAPDTEIIYQSETIAIIRLFTRLLQWDGTRSPFAPIFNIDGTVTVHARSY